MTPTPFSPLDRVPAPDLWPEIERRASMAAAGTNDVVDVVGLDAGRSSVAPRDRRLALSAAAVAIVVAAVGLALVWADGGDDGPDDLRTTPTAPPELACIDGGLAAGSIPDDASTDVRTGPDFVADGTQVRTWSEDGLTVQLLVPAPQYTDFVGERTEEVDDPEGTLWYRMEGDVALLAPTRLATEGTIGGPCAGYQLAVGGGDEDAERELALRIARRFSWHAEYGVTDCGPLSPWAINVVEGPTATAALTDPGVAGVLLRPDLVHEVSTMTRGPDGRCEINALTRGSLRPVVIVSGSGGTYGVDYIRGFAPVEPDDVTFLSVQVLGRSFGVGLGFWCELCVRTRVELSYPGQQIVGTADSIGSGQVVGELPAASAPGSYGILAVVVETESGDVRGLHVASIPSGDFAAS